jgi:hypothetical protein
MTVYVDAAEANRLLDVSLVPGTTYSCRLMSTAPSDAANGTELTGGGYAAQNFTMPAASNMQKVNTVAIAFPSPTTNWSLVVGMEFWTTAATPTRRWWKALSASEQRAATSGGSPLRIPIGSLIFQFS